MLPEPKIVVLRDLTVEDLTAKPVRRVAMLDRIKHIHHLQAKLFALGKTPYAIAAALGTSVTVLHGLLEDPAFQDLVEYYSSQVQEILLSNVEKAGVVGRMALDLLQERLETERVPTKDLIQITEIMGDRSDFAKRSATASSPTSPTITISFGTELKPKTQELTIEGVADASDS